MNGTDAHPVYKYLKSEFSDILGASIKWNFTKFLVDKDGRPFKRYGPTTNPLAIQADIETLLSRTQGAAAHPPVSAGSASAPLSAYAAAFALDPKQ